MCLAGVDISHLMHCAREGQLAASVRTSACNTHHTAKAPTDAIAVVTSLLKDQTTLDQEAIGILATHLRSCCPYHVGHSELTATLQAVEVLVQGNQVDAIVGCGLTSWLVGVLEELGEMGETATAMLDHVITLLVQAVSAILLTLTEGWLS